MSDSLRDEALRVESGSVRGSVALVTGASRGIGEALTRNLARDGATVVVAARSSDRIEQLASELGQDGHEVLPVVTDVTDIGDLDRLVEVTRSTYGRLDILVNNAGVLPTARRQERVELEDWERALRLNVTSAWYLATRAHALLKLNGGIVVNIASTAAHYPTIGLGPYNVSKAAMLMLTRSLALEWARDKIRVISISPGKVDTDMVRPIMEWVVANDAPINPLGRVASTSELSALITFLAGPAGAYITGCDIAFDGGEMITVPT